MVIFRQFCPRWTQGVKSFYGSISPEPKSLYKICVGYFGLPVLLPNNQYEIITVYAEAYKYSTV